MTDLSENIDIDESYDPNIINDQYESISNGSINGTLNIFDNDFKLSNETMRFLFIAIATIAVLICLTICISVCICICLNRRHKLKRQGKKDHRLLPEQSEKLSVKNSLSKNINSTLSSNVKQQSDKKILSSSIQPISSNIIPGKTPIRSYYYDNLDDIPFIDESRPTSYIDITRV